MTRVAVHFACTPRPFVLHVDTQEEADRLAERFRAYAGVKRVTDKAEVMPKRGRPKGPLSAIELEVRRRPRPGAKARRWVGEQLQALLAAYDRGDKVDTIAREFKTSIRNIYRLAYRHGRQRRGRHGHADPKAVRNLPPKNRDMYYALRPSIGHAAALAEAWRGQDGRGAHGSP